MDLLFGFAVYCSVLQCKHITSSCVINPQFNASHEWQAMHLVPEHTWCTLPSYYSVRGIHNNV